MRRELPLSDGLGKYLIQAGRQSEAQLTRNHARCLGSDLRLVTGLQARGTSCEVRYVAY